MSAVRGTPSDMATYRPVLLPHQRTALAAQAALLLCAIGAAPALGAQSVDNAVTGLAQLWSGSKAPPRCSQVFGRNGIDKQLLPFNCVWTAPAVPSGGSITGTVYARSGRTVVRWVRPTLDPDDANRVRDSLVTVLEARGLKERPCGAQGNDAVGLWATNALAVHIARVTENSGIPHLVVTATTDPDDTPEIVCARR